MEIAYRFCNRDHGRGQGDAAQEQAAQGTARDRRAGAAAACHRRRKDAWFQPSDIYCIVGHEADRVKAAVAPTGVKFVMQEEQRGTGHAMQMVKAYFAMIGRADAEASAGALRRCAAHPAGDDCGDLRAASAEKAAMTILTAVPPDPTGYGRVLRRQRGCARGDGDRRAEVAAAGAARRARDQLRHLLLRDRRALQQARSALHQQRARRVLPDRRRRDAGRRWPARGRGEGRQRRRGAGREHHRRDDASGRSHADGDSAAADGRRASPSSGRRPA